MALRFQLLFPLFECANYVTQGSDPSLEFIDGLSELELALYFLNFALQVADLSVQFRLGWISYWPGSRWWLCAGVANIYCSIVGEARKMVA